MGEIYRKYDAVWFLWIMTAEKFVGPESVKN
jgi:hypothetical protein